MPPRRPVPTTRYGRFALFIDGANFYHTLRDLNLHVDYRRVLDCFSTQGTLVRAHYYTALLEGSQTPTWLVRLTDWLAYNGYRVVTKQAKLVRRPIVDVQGESHWVEEVDGSVTVEFVVDMVTLAPHCDTLVLFSGDGQFVPVIRAVQALGCRVVLVSSQQTPASTLSDELCRQADTFLELVDLAPEICRQGNGKR